VDRLDSLYTSGQQKWRVAVHGSKHDATLFETLVRQECKVETAQGTKVRRCRLTLSNLG
jgi:hypothetical protein